MFATRGVDCLLQGETLATKREINLLEGGYVQQTRGGKDNSHKRGTLLQGGYIGFWT